MRGTSPGCCVDSCGVSVVLEIPGLLWLATSYRGRARAAVTGTCARCRLASRRKGLGEVTVPVT